jgi:Mor family transcriptional regulator
MISASEQKERLVLDLHNQGQNSREIAEIARISFSKIGNILRNAGTQKETDQRIIHRGSKAC